MLDEQIKKEIKELVENAKIAYISSIDNDGYPNVKAMLNLQRESFAVHYFSTNLFSKRVEHFKRSPKACIYFCDADNFKGMMLVGEMEVKEDIEHKTMLWRDGFEIYYPDGIETENYCIFKFTAIRGNYYHGLKNADFTAEELLDIV
ncbi:MAG: pyridoxamine 5'-phosphate oxidase family protein [Clostridia bacterium]|nr:pyridoxamine 5'-phosphate oxidase family protein [Clostridia bacterium]